MLSGAKCERRSTVPVEMLEGKKVIEIRLRGVSKALVAQRIRVENDTDAVIVAIGDDHSDDDPFRALPPRAISIAVGRQSTAARFRLDDWRNVCELLRSLVDDDATDSRISDRTSRRAVVA